MFDLDSKLRCLFQGTSVFVRGRSLRLSLKHVACFICGHCTRCLGSCTEHNLLQRMHTVHSSSSLGNQRDRDCFAGSLIALVTPLIYTTVIA